MGDANKRKEKGKKKGREGSREGEEVTLGGSEFMNVGHKPQLVCRLTQ